MDVQKVLVQQDPSCATNQIHQPWQDKPFSLGDFIQVSTKSHHKGKEVIVMNVKNMLYMISTWLVAYLASHLHSQMSTPLSMNQL